MKEKKTEPLYFDAFKVLTATVRCIGTGFNTVSLVNETIRLKSEKDYDQVWCVFDKDSFSNDNFNTAITIARNNEIEVAYSNEAFELWYLLHFSYVQTAISRHQYAGILNQYLPEPYDKVNKNMYSLLLKDQDTAIKNAKRLLEHQNLNNPATCNPITFVFELVEELNKHR